MFRKISELSKNLAIYGLGDVAVSVVNFFLLGHIVAQASGLPLERYTAERVFAPLGMNDTGFLPPIERVGRIAPTERCRFLVRERDHSRAIEWPARDLSGQGRHAAVVGVARNNHRIAGVWP